ncbi:hypothetical protein [Tetragenococcus halophilus]|nr:hypothetical protein [Tetragenococcus halophilus]
MAGQIVTDFAFLQTKKHQTSRLMSTSLVLKIGGAQKVAQIRRVGPKAE